MMIQTPIAQIIMLHIPLVLAALVFLPLSLDQWQKNPMRCYKQRYK